MHSDDSIRRGGFRQLSLRDRVMTRSCRPFLASGMGSSFQDTA
jgi:hypothetical protein